VEDVAQIGQEKKIVVYYKAIRQDLRCPMQKVRGGRGSKGSDPWVGGQLHQTGEPHLKIKKPCHAKERSRQQQRLGKERLF